MLRLGSRVTKEEFIKYAPFGLVLKHDDSDFVLYYDKYEVFNTEDYDEDYENDIIDGYCYGRLKSYTNIIEFEDPIMGAWDVIDAFIIHKLPKLKVLKRKPTC